MATSSTRCPCRRALRLSNLLTGQTLAKFDFALQPGDEVLATAVLDRLLHRANVLNIKGRSYRLRNLEQALSNQKS